MSPITGKPNIDNCFLNWCLRPVIGFRTNNVPPLFLSMTLNLVIAFSTIFLFFSKRIKLSSNKPSLFSISPLQTH